MDLLYLIIFIVITMIDDIETVLLKKSDLKSFRTKKILFVSEEPSEFFRTTILIQKESKNLLK